MLIARGAVSTSQFSKKRGGVRVEGTPIKGRTSPLTLRACCCGTGVFYSTKSCSSAAGTTERSGQAAPKASLVAL